MKTTKIWKTKQGKEIPIKELEDSHLNNIIALLERKAPEWLQECISDGYSCLSSLQGEMACYYAEQDIHSLECSTPIEFLKQHHPSYSDLVEERNKRNERTTRNKERTNNRNKSNHSRS